MNEVKEMEELVILLADYIILKNASERKTALYAKSIGYTIYNTTVKNLINNKLPSLDKEKYNKILEIRNRNKHKGFVDAEIHKRVLYNVELLKLGFTVEQIAIITNLAFSTVYNDITSILPTLDKNLAEEVKELLNIHRKKNGHCYKKAHINLQSLTLYNLKDKDLLEILLMALTFRISKKNMMKLFNTNLDDIDLIFQKNTQYSNALLILDYETKYESDDLSNLIYNKASEYLNEKNRLIEEVKNSKDLKIKKEKLETLRKLQEEINDQKVKNCLLKEISFWTQEEKDAVAKYILKYGLETSIAATMLGISQEEINLISTNLKKRDNIYKKKKEFQEYYFILQENISNKKGNGEVR